MRSFALESYLTTPGAAEIEALAALLRAMEATDGIRHLGSVALIEDEVCFHFFEAPSASAVLRAGERAGLDCERVIETVWTPA